MKFIGHLLFLILLLVSATLSAQQTIGLPAIANYDRTVYKGNGQTYDVSMDKYGILYFANNEGLITFNGSNWRLLPVPNKTRVRSVKATPDGRIYVGAQDDFGYFQPNDKGNLTYTSLKPQIPEGKRQFADVWNIEAMNGNIFFRTNNKIFRLDNKGKIDVTFSRMEWKIMGSSGKHLYAEDNAIGLYRFENNEWKLWCTSITDQQLVISAILSESNDTLLVATIKNGLYKIYRNQLIPVRTDADEAFRNTHIYCGLRLSPTQYAIGTFTNGLYIIDLPGGRIQQQFTSNEGLQSNNILRIFSDEARNLWLTLDNGIDHLHYNAAVKRIAPDKGNLLGAYTASVFQHKLYVGTIDGLFVSNLDSSADISLSKGAFTRIPKTSGQVWNLHVYNGHLLMGHNDGTFEISNTNVTPLLTDIGSWTYLPVGGRLIAGCYNGLAAATLEQGRFNIQRHINGLYESLRFLAPDDEHNIWSSHPYRGIYHLHFVQDSLKFDLYTQKEGLPSNDNNFVFTLQGRMVAATEAGIYEFQPGGKRFAPSKKWQQLFGRIPLQYLREDGKGNIWFVSANKVGLADTKTNRIIYFPELTDHIINGFEFIYPYDEENIFLAGDKGLIHLNYKKYNQQHTGPKVLMGAVMTGTRQTDSLLYGGYPGASAGSEPALANAFRNFRFEFSSPAITRSSNILYAYQLEGYDKEFSEWSPKTEKEYTNLPFGHYRFLVKAKDNMGNVSAPATYSFYIHPAWYQTWYAWCVYALLLVLAGYLVYQRHRKRLAAQQQRHLKEQEQLIISHQLEMERHEMQLVKLRNEKLQADVQHKNKELATAAMNIVQKGKTLSDIKEAFLEAVKKLSDPAPMPKFRKVMKLFEEAENNEDDWTEFSRHFDEVHNNFLLTLKKKFPELTTTDLKLCAYLRINLTTKEIAQTMGISVRGVETSRYRLRKKLEVPGETNLFDFLMEVTRES